jgi:cyclin-dependent kinase 8/11
MTETMQIQFPIQTIDVLNRGIATWQNLIGHYLKMDKLKSRVIDKHEIFKNNYIMLDLIGDGAYGNVHKGESKKEKGKFYAIKLYRLNINREREGIPHTYIREINMLKELDHENICRCKEILFDPKLEIIFVLEYGPYTLQYLIECHYNKVLVGHNKSLSSALPPNSIRSWMYQLLKGTEYLHQNFVMHRDLKSCNIVISETGSLKIIDFGLSRSVVDPLRSLGDDGQVVTVWYRAPELLLGTKHYTPAIDIWSIGCILGEMLLGVPLFKGVEKSKDGKLVFEEDQFEKICFLLGCPKKEDWPWLNVLPEYIAQSELKRFERHEHAKWTDTFKRYGKEDNLIDLLKSMLKWNPEGRPTATQALNHPYFSEDREKIVREPLNLLEFKYPPMPKVVPKQPDGKRAPDQDPNKDSKRKK